jgi:uncharacterized protein (DUF305 family)
MTRRNRSIAQAVTALVVVGFVVSVVSSTRGGDGGRNPVDVDGAFIAGMVPHHQSAVDMAATALVRSEHPAIERLSRAIIDTQTDEIGRLRAIHQRIFGSSLSSMGGQHGNMAMPAEHDMNAGALARARPFDRAFIDAMIPHHDDAIRMAEQQLKHGEDAELKRISRAIIDTQSREIAQLRQWRARWYGTPSTGDAAARRRRETTQTRDRVAAQRRDRADARLQPAEPDRERRGTVARRRASGTEAVGSPECPGELHAGQPPKALECGS